MASLGCASAFGVYVVMHQTVWREAERQMLLCDQVTQKLGGSCCGRVRLMTENDMKEQLQLYGVQRWNRGMDQLNDFVTVTLPNMNSEKAKDICWSMWGGFSSTVKWSWERMWQEKQLLPPVITWEQMP